MVVGRSLLYSMMLSFVEAGGKQLRQFRPFLVCLFFFFLVCDAVAFHFVLVNAIIRSKSSLVISGVSSLFEKAEV